MTKPEFNPVDYMRHQRSDEAAAKRSENVLSLLHGASIIAYSAMGYLAYTNGAPEGKGSKLVWMLVLALVFQYSCEVSGRPLRLPSQRHPEETNNLVRSGDLFEPVFIYYFALIFGTWAVVIATLYTGNPVFMKAWWIVPPVSLYHLTTKFILGWYVPYITTKKSDMLKTRTSFPEGIY
ncbi:hypothetical protein DICA3_C11232 [Diutina catenulata]